MLSIPMQFNSVTLYSPHKGQQRQALECYSTTCIIYVCVCAGHFCPEGTEFSTQYPCNNGTYNNATGGSSDAACQLCDPGFYCPGTGLSQPAGPCAGGWYCTLGSWSDKPAVLGNDTGVTCDCPAQSIGGKCLVGTFCPEGSDAPISCSAGSYCSSDGLSNVTGPCQAGYFCSGGATIPNPVNETFGDVCPQGHYCPEGSGAAQACLAGTYTGLYGNQNSSDCLPCTAGQYCPSPGLAAPAGDCDVGWFCPEGMTQPQPSGNQCLAGHSCPQGSPTQTPCPSGSYQPIVEQGTCLSCPSGYYCDQNEAIAEQQSGGGEPSHGVVTPKVCPAGFYCPNGTQTDQENPCPAGTYSNTTGLEMQSQCQDCPPGEFCDVTGLTSPTGQCSAGYYCVSRSSSPTPALSAEGGPCQQGTYCEQGASVETPCPKGTYGDRALLPSLADCTICPPGEFCAQSGLSAPNGSCLAGYYCTNGSEEANPVGQSYGDECPSGYYCPAHSYQPTACPAGSYNPNTQRTDSSACLACDPGNYCNSTGLSSMTGSCDEGYYCISSASSSAPTDGTTGNICPEGSYCPLGSSQHLFCPNGTYTNHTGAAACYDCPAGYYCVNRDRADLCLPGFYCPDRTGANLQACPAGTYNPVYGLSMESQCTQCDGGKYCLTPGLSAVSGDCTAGYYCRFGEFFMLFVLSFELTTPIPNTHTHT